MKAELKHDWLGALRSGEYEQAQERLRVAVYTYDNAADKEVMKQGHCCLGVLCEVIVKKGLFGLKSEPRMSDDSFSYQDDEGHTHYLSQTLDQFCSVVGLTSAQEDTLVHLNDGDSAKGIQQSNFLEIADWIEANVKEE